MYQRGSGANASSIRIPAALQHQQQQYSVLPAILVVKDDSIMPELATASSTSGVRTTTTLTKKLLLTLLLLVQICFIACLLLLHLDGPGDLNANYNEITARVHKDKPKTNASSNVHIPPPRTLAQRGIGDGAGGVNFITKAVTANVEQHATTTWMNGAGATGMRSSNFSRDFYLKSNRLNNKTKIELRNGSTLTTLQADIGELWCFREGSIDEIPQLQEMAAAVNNEALASWEEVGGEEEEEQEADRQQQQQCKCRAGWHGRDCGQPEVIWRALLTAKSRFPLRQPNPSRAAAATTNANTNRLIYLLEGNFLNLDLLDIQIRMLSDIVDYFVIFVRATRTGLIKTLEHFLKETLTKKNYLLFECRKQQQMATKTGEKSDDCTSVQAYEYFRRRLKQQKLTLQTLTPTDLLLHTNDHVLPSRQALNFLKYYALDVRNVPLRLKYNVYGFYWQHPEQTKVNGVISSFLHIDNQPQLLNSDGAVGGFAASEPPPPFVIGDLNHFGGWYCKYCQQPEEIVAELHVEMGAQRQVQFPIALRGRNIDVTYLQKLIANGLYVDGKTQLLRNRRYSDQYYAPAVAENSKTKYGNLLVNLYESFDDDIEYEDGNY